MGQDLPGDRNERDFILEIRELASARNRSDIVSAIDASLRRSAVLRPIIGTCKQTLRVPGLWRLGAGIRDALLRKGPF